MEQKISLQKSMEDLFPKINHFPKIHVIQKYLSKETHGNFPFKENLIFQNKLFQY
jgi:hypothetical protein